MKKALSGILAALVLLSSLPTAMTASALPSDSDVEDRTIGHEVYVSTTGNDDTGDGSQGKPFATIETVSYTHLFYRQGKAGYRAGGHVFEASHHRRYYGGHHQADHFGWGYRRLDRTFCI